MEGSIHKKIKSITLFLHEEMILYLQTGRSPGSGVNLITVSSRPRFTLIAGQWLSTAFVSHYSSGTAVDFHHSSLNLFISKKYFNIYSHARMLQLLASLKKILIVEHSIIYITFTKTSNWVRFTKTTQLIPRF